MVAFDGRDKISSTAGLAVSHSTWPTAIDALHAQMAAAFDTSRWGVSFFAPVGTNTPQQNADGIDHFSYAGIEVMAKDAGTVVSIDTNADGDFVDATDRNAVTINEGQTVFVNGGVSQGARILTTKPVQAFLMTGRIGSNYEDRTFQLFPTEGLVNDYIAPATTASSADYQATTLYIFNPQASAITVTVTTSSGSTNYTVPAGQTLNPAPFLGVNQPARITSSSTFAALAADGTRNGAVAQDFDWGYSLVPARLLSTSINVGWAIGSQDLSAANYDPVWVTTTGATTLYADYDGDPTTGPNLDPNGARYDTSYTVAGSLTLTKVTDTSDNDMTGAHIYTTNGVTFAAAYGEDPSTAPLAFPGIDLGTALFPSCGSLCVQKSMTIADDGDGDGQVDPGDTIEWTITAANTGYYSITNAVLRDTLPAGLTYVDGTAMIGASPLADDVVPPAATGYPFDESGRNLGTVAIGGSITVKFRTTVNNPYDGPSTSKVSNRAIVISDQASGGDTSEAPLDSLRISKTSNATVPVTVGQTLDYTITVQNTGSSTLTTIPVTDALPRGLTWVSTTVTRPVNETDTFADDFQTNDWSGSTGDTAWSQATWQELNDSTLAPIYDTGQVRSITDSGGRRARLVGPAPDDGISRVAGDLSSYTLGATLQYDYRRAGLEVGDVVAAEIRPNASAAWTTLATYTNGGDAGYVAASFNVAAYIGTATEVRFRVTSALDDNTDILFVDNVTFTGVKRVPSTVAGSAPTTLYTLSELLAGETAMIVVSTTVASTPDAEIINTATATTGSFISRARVSDCAICFDFGDVPASYDTGNPGRARIASTPVLVTSTIADDFETAANWQGSTGTVAWADTAWTETDNTAGTTVGTVRKLSDFSDLSLHFTNGAAAGRGVLRTVGNLTSYTSTTLSMEKRCNGLETGDVVQLQIRPDASSAWQTLFTYANCNDGAYVAQSFPLTSGQIGTATAIQFVVTDSFGTGTPDQLFIDNVRFDLVTPTFPPTGPTLGTNLDRELAAASAAPGAAPTGDDTAGVPDDEDGVTVPSIDTGTMTVSFTIADPSGGVTAVNGWFDWDNNGVFDTSESIFASGTFVSATGGLTASGSVGAAPGPGTYSVTFTVPDLANNGSGFTVGSNVYSRFRVASSSSQVAASKAKGLSTDGEVEDYRSTLNTLPVTLSYIGSARRGGNVNVSWRTAQEVDNLGFNIYAPGSRGTKVLLTPQMIVSTAPTSIIPQSYTATIATAAKTFFIEDVALDGTREMRGPFKVDESYGDPSEPTRFDWDDTQEAIDQAESEDYAQDVVLARAASLARRESLAAKKPITKTGPLARFTVTEAGVQEVTFEQLAAVGVDLTGIRSALLAVTDPSGPVAVEIIGPASFGPGSAIRFVGEPLDTLYSGENVYRLQVDKTLVRRVRTPGNEQTKAGTVTTHLATASVEKQVQYSATSPSDDPFYERDVVARSGRVRSASTIVEVTDLVPGTSATVSVDLWGITRDRIEDDHHARLSLNGVVIAEARFDDNEGIRLEGRVAPGVVLPGPNEMTVTLLGDTGAYIDIVAIDSWQVRYTRSAVAVDGRLDITTSGGTVTVSGMPDGSAAAYRVGKNKAITKYPVTVADGVATLAAPAGSARYLVTSDSAVESPAVTPARAPAKLIGGSADYLVVTHPMFAEALEPLVELHRSEGMKVKVVDVNDIYEAYSGGVVDAAAIDRYLAQALPAFGARFLLLVGGDSIDYRDYDGDGAAVVMPSLYGSTGFGITYAPIDPAYADVDGDGLADVAMGRLPARTVDELTTMVAKTVQMSAAAGDRSVLLVSGERDGLDYASANDAIAQTFEGWAVHRADTDRQGVDAARAELISTIESGVGLTMYLGHSGSAEWSNVGLFNASAAAALSNVDSPTVLAQVGCWTTYYVSPMEQSISQAFLDAEGGAGAVMGATTLTSAAHDIALAHHLAAGFAAGGTTVGEVLLAAKRGLHDDSPEDTVDVQLGWSLLGDPALPAPGGG